MSYRRTSQFDGLKLSIVICVY